METLKCKCLLLIMFCSICCKGTLSQTNKPDNPTKTVLMNNTGTESQYAHMNETDAKPTCKLIPILQEMCDELAFLANGEYKLVKLNVQIEGTNTTDRSIYSSSIYQPRKWVIATSATGKSMLMLREYFEPMSFYTLGYGVANLDIIAQQQPADCLHNIGINQIENLLRENILSNFGYETGLQESAEICNQHIENKGTGVAKLVYICCRNDLTPNGTVQCQENSETIWIHLLFISLFIIQGFVVAFCPLILPDTLFKAKTVFQKYVFKTQPEKLLVLNVKKVESTKTIGATFVKTIRHKFTSMSGFRSHLADMKTGKVYTMYVDGLDLSVLESKIIADGSAPVGVVQFIYQFFIRCALRKEIKSVSECCNSKLFKSISARINLRWYQCLRVVMIFLSIVIIFLPWIHRVWFYYTFEDDVMRHRMALYGALNLTMPFNGFVVAYLSPLHPLFIAIYIILGLEVVFYVPQPDTVKRKLKFTIRKCFRDMRQSSRMTACGYFVSKMLYPLSRFGIVGCLVVPLWVVIMPCLLLILALDALPIANLTLRLLANLVYYTLRLFSPQKVNFVSKNENGLWKRWINNRLAAILVTDFQEQNTRINQLVHASSLIMSLVSIWCVLFLAVDCIAFYAECVVYGLIGFILTPRDTMKYVSLGLLIIVYGIDCFSGVNGKYVAYGQAINAKVQSMIGDRLKDVAAQSATDQVNSAFRLEDEENIEHMFLVAGSERYLKWRAPRLVLFLDKFDITYIPKSFLMQMGRLKHAICPGQVHLLYLKALLDFSLILLFLLFVFIVIFAFGQAQDISSGGQAIAALGSGFLPLILRKFLFQSHSVSVDTSNMQWNYIFLNAIKTYKDRWNFEDIHVTRVEEAKPKEQMHSDKELSTCVTDVSESNVENEADANDHNADDDVACENDIALLPKCAAPKLDVDLKVKTVQLPDGQTDFEFYVPAIRAAECEDDELLNEDDVQEYEESETVV